MKQVWHVKCSYSRTTCFQEGRLMQMIVNYEVSLYVRSVVEDWESLG